MARWLASLLACLALAPAEDPLEGARERWEAMSAEERAEIERRFDELNAMDAERRAEIEQRYELVCSAERTALAEMSERSRRQLEELPAGERGVVVRELAREALAERARRAQEHLPATLRERLEHAVGVELDALVREIKLARRDERLSRALERLAGELGLSPEEQSAIAGLSTAEREAKLFELHQRRLERRVQRDGLPEWIAPEEWESWRGLTPREFRSRLAERQSAPLRPDPEWHVELGRLPAQDRRAQIEKRLKTRALELLARRPDAPEPAELERLRSLEGQAFFESLRPWTERTRPFGPPRGR